MPNTREITASNELVDISRISDKIGVVVIGRNEGERLIACLVSVKSETNKIVYVDSGSTDGSTTAAERLGASIVNLDLTQPFTAARARNEGFRMLRILNPNIRFVQFVDGDCVLTRGWLQRAMAFIEENKEVAIVSGRLRERYPAASIYNLLCDIEWDMPIGEIDACGGNSLVRVEAFEAANGFRSELIGGEEPELCLRLRQRLWSIWRIDHDMGQHDAAITRFSQWWTRSVRTGFGLAGVWMLYQTPQLSSLGKDQLVQRWRRQMASTVFWGGIMPITICLSAVIHPAALGVGLAAYLVQVARITLGYGPTASRSWTLAVILAVILMVTKFAHFQGVLIFLWHRVRHQAIPRFQYK
jgi:glycosyltransferase involved in cell wall biosynthesis